MSTLLGLVIGLILTKALIEPLAARIGRRYIPSAVARTLDLLDPFMPRLMAELPPAQLEALVRRQLETLTGESWKVDGQLAQFFEVFDPRIAAAKAVLNAELPESLREFLNEAD
jgi:hypothetical protein